MIQFNETLLFNIHSLTGNTEILLPVKEQQVSLFLEVCKNNKNEDDKRIIFIQSNYLAVKIQFVS